MIKTIFFVLLINLLTIGCSIEAENADTSDIILSMRVGQTYRMPDETQVHEGTWLQWPHAYQYGTTYRNRLDATWVSMTKALAPKSAYHCL